MHRICTALIQACTASAAHHAADGQTAVLMTVTDDSFCRDVSFSGPSDLHPIVILAGKPGIPVVLFFNVIHAVCMQYNLEWK